MWDGDLSLARHYIFIIFKTLRLICLRLRCGKAHEHAVVLECSPHCRKTEEYHDEPQSISRRFNRNLDTQ
jgi:hypothetical protein